MEEVFWIVAYVFASKAVDEYLMVADATRPGPLFVSRLVQAEQGRLFKV